MKTKKLTINGFGIRHFCDDDYRQINVFTDTTYLYQIGKLVQIYASPKPSENKEWSAVLIDVLHHVKQREDFNNLKILEGIQTISQIANDFESYFTEEKINK